MYTKFLLWNLIYENESDIWEKHEEEEEEEEEEKKKKLPLNAWKRLAQSVCSTLGMAPDSNFSRKKERERSGRAKKGEDYEQ